LARVGDAASTGELRRALNLIEHSTITADPKRK